MALVALVGLGLAERSPLSALAPLGGWLEALGAGLACGVGAALLLSALRVVPALARLERWQRGLVAGWTVADAVAVAALSGLAEEALIRAYLQPMIGLVPAALVFALLHIVPDRQLWLWPVVALALGLGLGLLFVWRGYPAAALAHFGLNTIALLRLRH